MPCVSRRIVSPLLCGLAIAIVAGSAYGGTNPTKPFFKFHQDVWRTEQGLPQNTVPAIVQSKDGYIWIGTELGLVRFDGSRFFVFDKSNTPELQSNVVDALLEDHAGNLWIGTVGGGVTRLTGRRFQTFTLQQGLSSDSVHALLEDDFGDIWIGTDSGGLDRFHNGHITAYTTADGLPDNEVFSLAKDRAGAIWVGTHEGLSRFAFGVFRNYTKADGLSSAYIRAVYASRKALWIGTYGGGLCKLDGAGFKCFSSKDGLSSNTINSIQEDSSGNLWIATSGGGLDQLTGNVFRTYTNKDGLPTEDVWTVFEDRDRNLWIGTGGGGLVRLVTHPLFQNYDTRDGLSNDVVLPIYQDHEGTIWIGTNGGGLNSFRDGRFTALTNKDGLADNLVFSICEDHEHSLWIGTHGGLNRLKNGKFTTYTKKDGLPADVALVTFVDSRGTLWIGTRGGLSQFSNGQFKTYTTQDGLGSNIVRTIYEDHKGRLWIGTAGGGLSVFQKQTFRTYNSHQGLSNNVVLAIDEDSDGVFWIGTNGGGLNRFRDGKFTSYKVRDGLLDDAVFRILEDGSGNLWMSSNRGVSRVSRKELNEFADGAIRRLKTISYGASDGMSTAECNGSFQPAGWKTSDGRLWFPTMRGISVVNPATALNPATQQAVSIDAAFINGDRVDETSVVVPPGPGKLEFYYSSPNFRSPQRVNFRYRLVGFDLDWVEAGRRRMAFYTNIPPGRYQFEVNASNGEGTWTATTATFAMQLQPHFYQTFYFYILCLLVGMAMVTALHLGHIRALHLRERALEIKVAERTRELRGEIAERKRTELELVKAKEAAERASRVKSEFLAHMSHEIRTPMNGILGMTELALSTESKAEQQSYLDIVRNSAESLLTVINEILDFSKVEAGKLELDLVDLDLRECLAGTIASMNVRAQQKGLRLLYTIHPGVPPKVQTDPVRLNQIVTNLVNNAIKFTSEGEVELYIRCQSRDDRSACLHFTVRDTGIGIRHDKLQSIFEAFSQADSSTTRQFGGTGLGLAICYRLVQLMGGDIWAESEVGQGSEFHFTVTCNLVKIGAASQTSRKKSTSTKAKLRVPAGKFWHVLLAEDNPANRLVARASLKQAGLQLTEVENGLEAIEAVKRLDFDAVLMDCRMPLMDGYMATRFIRQLPGKAGQVPIIALTASAFKEDREKAKEAGMNDFVTKPFHSWELVAKCLQWIKISAGGDQASAGARQEPDDDASFTTELMQVFLDTAPAAFAKLMRALEAKDWAGARGFAHWLQGGATRMLCPELQERLSSIESECLAPSPLIGEAELALLQTVFETAIRTVQLQLGERRAYSAST